MLCYLSLFIYLYTQTHHMVTWRSAKFLDCFPCGVCMSDRFIPAVVSAFVDAYSNEGPYTFSILLLVVGFFTIYCLGHRHHPQVWDMQASVLAKTDPTALGRQPTFCDTPILRSISSKSPSGSCLSLWIWSKFWWPDSLPDANPEKAYGSCIENLFSGS